MNVEASDVTFAIACWGAVTGTASLVLTRRDSVWKRRHTNLELLRPAIEALTAPMENWTDPQTVQTLFSPTSGAQVETLRDGLDTVPDYRCRRWLRSFVASLTAFRGAQATLTSSGPATQLTKAQKRDIKAANDSLDKIQARLAKAAQKGRS